VSPNLRLISKPPKEIRTYSLASKATDLPIDVLPTPGGPVKQIIVISYHFAILKLQDVLSFFNFLVFKMISDLIFFLCFKSKLSFEYSFQGKSKITPNFFECQNQALQDSSDAF
jgi:hypothetical protein